MTEHGNLFLKSIISSYEVHSFFRYLIIKLEKLTVTKYVETTTFCKSPPPPPPIPFDQCQWTDKLHRHYAADRLLTHNIDIGEGEGGLNRAIFKFFDRKLKYIVFYRVAWL